MVDSFTSGDETMQLAYASTPSPLREDESGVIRVGATRVTLDSVVSLFEQGASPEEIALRFDVLGLPEVYATLSFYLSHGEEVKRYLAQQQDASERARLAAQGNPQMSGLRRRLLLRKRRTP